MKFIREDGTYQWTTKKGDTRSTPAGIFECPVCKKEVRKRMYAGIKNRTCSMKCRRTEVPSWFSRVWNCIRDCIKLD